MLVIQRLQDVLKRNRNEDIEILFRTFKCEVDEDIANFLIDYAIEYEIRGISRTFLVMDTEYPNHILGYYSIGMNVICYDNEIYERIINVDDNQSLDVPNAYEGINLYEEKYHPIYKLFMIGKNDNCPIKLDMKKEVFPNLIDRIKKCKKEIGINLIYLDCVKGKLESYYSDLGFTNLDNYVTSNNDEMVRMIMKIKEE